MTELKNFGISIRPNGGRYKSIETLDWNEIPGLAIITGRNGSGKTQLLELLSYHLTGTRPAQMELGVNVMLNGASFDADEVGFISTAGRFSSGGASIAELQGTRSNFYQQAQNKHSYQHDPAQMAKARRAEKMLGGQSWQSATNNGQRGIFEDEFDALLVDVDVTSSLATIFVAYRVKRAESIERGTPGIGRDGKPLGPPPWDVVNESLKVAGFPYVVSDPERSYLTDYYLLTLIDTTSGIEIRPDDLSSGEQVILQLTLWLFSSSKDGVFPRLLLLDEPDAHLHPSMTLQFLDVISEVLVRKHGVRVIMTTHSPSTVALAPDGAVFQMERGNQTVLPVTDRAAIIKVLTAGLVTVSAATRFCFVEDEDDVVFYNTVLEILSDLGPSKDPYAINSTPSIAFIAASVGSGAEKISGGKSIVEKWIEKLNAPPLTTTFLGVLDRDIGNQPSNRIKVIGRYSFENYLLDPINVFGLLLENNSAPPIIGVSVTSGDEHILRTLSAPTLQSIADVITGKVKYYRAEGPSRVHARY